MIPFLDLKAQHASLKDELEAAACRVLGSGHYVLGEEVERFEDHFASYCGTRFAIALNTGTSALHLALLAAGVGPGDEVITPAMTFVATTAAIIYAGARPVLVDIDPASWTIDPDRVAAAVTPRTKAILPVHLHGRVAAMEPLLTVAAAHGLAVIEDAAQAHGAEQGGRRAGGIGDAGCFSFYPGKNLGACGEGGAVVTNDARLADAVRLLRDWGQAAKYHHVAKGYNYRMDAIQGAILAVKLRHLESWTEARRRHARRYDALLAGTEVGLPAAAPEGEHVHHVYAVRVRERDRVRDRLGEMGVATGIHYPVPVHLQPAYADLGYRRGDFPVAEGFAAETLSLPMYPELSADLVAQVAEAVRAVTAAPVVGESR